MKWMLNDEDFACIGRVALEATQTEMTLDLLIPAILRLDVSIYKTLTHGKPVAQKIQMFREAGLSRIRGKNRIADFTKVTAVMAKLNELRNLAIHGHWTAPNMTLGKVIGFNTADNLVASTPRNKKLRLTRRRLSQLPREMQDVNQRLFRFWREAWVRPPARQLLNHNRQRNAAIQRQALG